MDHDRPYGPTTPLTPTLSAQDDGWRLLEQGWSADRSVAVGSNFLVGNGYLGYRGTSPEQTAGDYVGLTVSDTYDCADGKWRELCTVPNPLFVAAEVAGTPVGVARADDVRTWLDLRTGEFGATLSQTLPSGGTVRVSAERVASAADHHVLAQRWRLDADVAVDVDVVEGIDGAVWSLNGDHFAEVVTGETDAALHAVAVTGESGVRIAVVRRVTARVGRQDLPTPPSVGEGRSRLVRHRVRVTPDAPLVLETVATVVTSNDPAPGATDPGATDPGAARPDADGARRPDHDPLPSALAAAARAADRGVDGVRDGSSARWAEIWSAMDIEIAGAPVDQVALRFAAYHNRICTPVHTDHLPVGARGLSCQAYQGAAFWDQEIYNLPAFLFTDPEVARRLLVYRHRTLDGARRKAARLGHRGAFYAWISGDTGDELCPDYFFVDVLTGRPIRNHFNDWQIHVSPDVVTTMVRYAEVTGDREFLVDHAAEVAFEVARFLRSFVRYDEWRGTYHCMRLLGPDEWHENVDDNAFTNHQVRAALDAAVRLHATLAAEHPAALAALAERLSLEPDEVAAWARVRDRLYLPAPDPGTGLVEQFPGFFDLEDTTAEVLKGRLLHPQEYWGWPNGVAVATQVSKQADVVALMWQHRHSFDFDVQRANYAYYEPRCSHFSTLSHPPHGFVAIATGDTGRGLAHWRRAATVDLLTTAHAVVGGTFIGGIHTAACGGTYQLVHHGFGGLDVVDGVLRIDPALPAEWESLRYPVAWRGTRLRVTATHDGVTVVHEGPGREPVDVMVQGLPVRVAPGDPVPAGPAGGSAGR
ncbi:MAG: glycosyl hydrolase family 65 protein [Kineosporiaceae bacterium]